MSSRPEPGTFIKDCTVRELILELDSRCPCIVFGAKVPDVDGKKEPETVVYCSSDDRSGALGLATLLKAVCLRKLLKELEVDDGL